jgi:hypothetical protein
MSDETPDLIRHLELHLGPMTAGSIFNEPRIQVARFANQPFDGAITYATLGLSNHVLQQRSGSPLRMELLFSCYIRFEAWNLSGLPALVVQDVLREHNSVERGQVLGPAGPIDQRCMMEGFYCAAPVAYPDDLKIFRGTDPPTIFVWLIPVTHDEIHYVSNHGWSAFEDLIEKFNPDLCDLERPSMLGDERLQ